MPTWINGPFSLTSEEAGADGLINLFIGDHHKLGFVLRDGNRKPLDTTGCDVTFLVTDTAREAIGDPIASVVEWNAGGVHTYPLQEVDTATVQKLNLTAMVDGGEGDVLIVGPITLSVRAR